MSITLSDNELKDLLAELLPEDVQPVPTLTDAEVTSLIEQVFVLTDDDLDDDINELLDRLNK